MASEELQSEFIRVGKEVERLRLVSPHQLSEEQQSIQKQHDAAVLSLEQAEAEHCDLEAQAEERRKEAAAPQPRKERKSKQRAAQVAELKAKAKFEAVTVLRAEACLCLVRATPCAILTPGVTPEVKLLAETLTDLHRPTSTLETELRHQLQQALAS